MRADDPSVPWVRPEPPNDESIAEDVLGPELVPDPFFNGNGTWFTGGGRGSDSDWDLSGDGIYIDSPGSLTIETGDLGVEDGNTYRMTIEIAEVVSGQIEVLFDRAALDDAYDAAGTYTADFDVSVDAPIAINVRSAVEMRITRLSVRRKF